MTGTTKRDKKAALTHLSLYGNEFRRRPKRAAKAKTVNKIAVE